MDPDLSSRIVVIGSINADLVATVDHLPHRGETITAKALHQHLGGKGANQAVATAKLGSKVTMVGCVGDDEAGNKAISGLRRAGVDHRHVRVVPDTPTGTALITVGNQGDNTIVVVPGANEKLVPADIQTIQEDLVTAQAVLLQLEVADDVVRATIELINERREHCNSPWLVFNPSPFRRSALPPPGSIDLLLVNELEAKEMSGINVQDPNTAARAAHQLLQALRPGGCVVITLGAQGAVALAGANSPFASHQDRALYIPAVQVNAIDTTGAGDVFTGALVAKLADGQELTEALRFATAASSITVTRSGAQSSFPDNEEVENVAAGLEKPQAMQDHYGEEL